MKKKDRIEIIKNNWHICLLAVVLLFISLQSCGIAISKITDWMADEQGEESETIITQPENTSSREPSLPMTAEPENGNPSGESKLVRLLSGLDRVMDHIDRLWDRSIYRKADLSRMDSVYTYLATGQIASSQVVCGTEGWMFYKSPNDGNSMADYEGTNRYSEQELETMLSSVLMVQTEAESRGIQFAILIPPNKENVYSEYMPKQYRHEPVSSTDILIEYLKSGGVCVCSPKSEMLDCYRDYQLYYFCDSHWNQLGAYLGVKTVLDEWGIGAPPLSEREISADGLKENYHDSASDDLARMAGLLQFFDHEMDYMIEGTVQPDWDVYSNEQGRGSLSTYINKEAKTDKTLMLVGDSFRTAMIPALREMFREVYVIHRSSYQPEMLQTVHPDCLIAEYVERYSSEIKDIGQLF